MDSHDAVRTPSTSSAHSEADISTPTRFRLLSPLGGEALILDWDFENPPIEKVNTWMLLINQCCHKFDAIKTAFDKHKDDNDQIRPITLTLPKLLSDPNDTSDPDITGSPKERYYKKFQLIVQTYNANSKAFSGLWKGASNPFVKSWSQDRCDTELLNLICNTTFNSAVRSVKLLNSHYIPFSSEVYGETRNDQMQLIIDQLNFKDNDIFLDLGSGVGNLVLYVAGATKVKKAIGIEKAEVPAEYANTMQAEFKKLMQWFKKKHRPFELHNGDFLDPKYKSIIQEATIIFINNFAFNPDLENRIKMEIINELATGRRIVSTKPYAPVSSSKTFNPRSANQMEAILDVEELKTVAQPTSWTDKIVPYYLHTVNQAKLQEYYDLAKTKTQNSSQSSLNNSRRTSVSSKSNSSNSSREGSQPTESNLPNGSIRAEVAIGPTTRKQWKIQIGEDQKSKKRSPNDTPAWNEPDREYLPSGMKKIKKEMTKPVVVVKGPKTKTKPIKPPMSRVRISTEETNAALDQLHMMAGQQRPIELGGPGLERVHLSRDIGLPTGNPDSPSLPEEAALANLPPGSLVLIPGRGNDDFFIDWIRAFNGYINKMNNEESKQILIEEIQTLQQRNADLLSQVQTKEIQVKVELNKGLGLVQTRFGELGMANVETPTELLQNSKRIVADHKELTQNVSQIEAENAHLSGRLRNAVPYGAPLLENLPLLEEPSLWDVEKDKMYTQFLNRIAIENGHQPPKEPEPEMTEGVLSPTGPRQRRTKPRNGPGRKGKQEENSEELDRQVQEFVQVALSVDQQAKEKERRARAAGPAAEKSSKKSTTPGVGSGDPHAVPLPRNNFPSGGSYPIEIRHDYHVTSTN